MRCAPRILRTDPPPLTPIMRRAADLRSQGRSLYVLGQAMVDYAPPGVFLEALRSAGTANWQDLHGYAPDPGREDLRFELAGYVERTFGFEVDPHHELLVTPGANHAAYTALAVLLEEEGEVILVSPYYFNHEMSICALGGTVRLVSGRADCGFFPPVDQVLSAWSPRTRALILVHPNNPTGVCYPGAFLRELGDALASDSRWQEVWILCDQTYQEIYFGDLPPFSPATLDSLKGRVLTVSSFSRSMGLAGWRLGFLCGPAAFVDEALKIQDSSVICAPHAAQWALCQALQDVAGCDQYFADKRVLLAARREALLAPIERSAFLDVVRPGGACFAFVGLPEGLDAGTFAIDLLESSDVVVVPGAVFGADWGNYLRVSFGSGSESYLAEAAGRLVEFTERRVR